MLKYIADNMNYLYARKIFLINLFNQSYVKEIKIIVISIILKLDVKINKVSQFQPFTFLNFSK